MVLLIEISFSFTTPFSSVYLLFNEFNTDTVT
jgi:hypothetical protein